MSNFVDSPMSKEFIRDDNTPPSGSETNGCKDGPFGQYTRTHSPNAVEEVTYDNNKAPKPSGESDQF